MVSICEVGPRDGLQNQKRVFTPEERAQLVVKLADAGIRHIEAVSFVNPQRVPQMGGAEEVLAALPALDGVTLSGLVLNARGAERALHTRVHEVRFAVVASETFSMRNQNASVAKSLDDFARVAEMTRRAGRRMTGVIGAAYGCPFEGRVPVEQVAQIVERMCAEGADEIIFADTIGVAVPADIQRVAEVCTPLLQDRPFGAHLHNTRNTGYACAIEAVRQGATVLDSAVGGLGGCPFAPHATGNIATEDLNYLLARETDSTPLDHDALSSIVNWLSEALPGQVSGQLARAGWPVGHSEHVS